MSERGCERIVRRRDAAANDFENRPAAELPGKAELNKSPAAKKETQRRAVWLQTIGQRDGF
jgi:hypothetical protein